MMRAARGLLAWLLLAGLVGCGGDASPRPSAATSTPARTATATATAPADSAEQRAVKAMLARYAQAVRAGDARAICTSLLSQEVLRRVKQAGGDCERDLIADAVATGGPGYVLEVKSVEVHGRQAGARTVVTDRRDTHPQIQPLVRERGGWRLAVG